MKADTKEKTHSSEISARYFYFLLSVLLYNLQMLLDLTRRMSGSAWKTIMDFLMAMNKEI